MTYGYWTDPLEHSPVADSDFAPPTRGELFMRSRPDLYPYIPGGAGRQARLLQLADALPSTAAADWAAYSNDRQRLASEALLEALRGEGPFDPMAGMLDSPKSIAELWAETAAQSPPIPAPQTTPVLPHYQHRMLGPRPAGNPSGEWENFARKLPIVEGFRRAEELYEEVKTEAWQRALQEAGGDPAKAEMSLHNGPGDAWRHAEWSRRVAEEVNPLTSFAAGAGHEVWDGLGNVGRTISHPLGLSEAPYPWDQQFRESWHDLNSNRIGRSKGVTPVEWGEPGLTYGPGGPGGDPQFTFSDYSLRRR